jgi:hypothetical protein
LACCGSKLVTPCARRDLEGASRAIPALPHEDDARDLEEERERDESKVELDRVEIAGALLTRK